MNKRFTFLFIMSFVTILNSNAMQQHAHTDNLYLLERIETAQEDIHTALNFYRPEKIALVLDVNAPTELIKARLSKWADACEIHFYISSEQFERGNETYDKIVFINDNQNTPTPPKSIRPMTRFDEVFSPIESYENKD